AVDPAREVEVVRRVFSGRTSHPAPAELSELVDLVQRDRGGLHRVRWPEIQQGECAAEQDGSPSRPPKEVHHSRPLLCNPLVVASASCRILLGYPGRERPAIASRNGQPARSLHISSRGIPLDEPASESTAPNHPQLRRRS